MAKGGGGGRGGGGAMKARGGGGKVKERGGGGKRASRGGRGGKKRGMASKGRKGSKGGRGKGKKGSKARKKSKAARKRSKARRKSKNKSKGKKSKGKKGKKNKKNKEDKDEEKDDQDQDAGEDESGGEGEELELEVGVTGPRAWLRRFFRSLFCCFRSPSAILREKLEAQTRKAIAEREARDHAKALGGAPETSPTFSTTIPSSLSNMPPLSSGENPTSMTASTFTYIPTAIESTSMPRGLTSTAVTSDENVTTVPRKLNKRTFKSGRFGAKFLKFDEF